MEENTSDNKADLNDVISRFNNILKDKDINLGKILGDNEENSEFNFDFDLDTLIKLKNFFQKVNDNNNPRNRLLYSLKPFLKDSRKQKLDEYIKIANILVIMNVISDMNSLYLILIIILLTK